MLTYSIKKDNTTYTPVCNFPWDETGYRPACEFLITLSDDAFIVRFQTQEEFIRNEMTEHNTLIHTDSCVEFFCIYDPNNSNEYINIEINPNGCAKFKIGAQRNHRKFLTEEELSSLQIQATLSDDKKSWTVDYQIPFKLIKKYYPHFEAKKGHRMKGNVYKCGDETKFPHFACWNPIGNPTPDFHLSEYFGDFIIE